MTEIIDDKSRKQKLKLGANKLSFNKTIEVPSITKTFIKSNTIIEVRKSKYTSDKQYFSNQEENLESNKVDKRLDFLKKAIEAVDLKSNSNSNETLGKLSTINQIQINSQLVDVVESNNNNQDNGKDLHITSKVEKKHTLIKKDVSKIEANLDLEEGSNLKKLSSKVLCQPKTKVVEKKKFRKADLIYMLDDSELEDSTKSRSLASIKRAREKEKRKFEKQKQQKIYREVSVQKSITVGELAIKMAERSSDVISELKKLGIIAKFDQEIDVSTAEIVAASFGHSVKVLLEPDVEGVFQKEDFIENLQYRSPVVTVMGHVDHGKTSLLDSLRSINTVNYEEGGITQHIGAYRVEVENGKFITFIDTPGHEAFTNMRIRGSQITDIVVLLIAADDGIKPQTIEAINHSKAAGVPIIVAINKIDRSDINIELIKSELLNYDLVAEEFGGDVMVVPISAIKKINLSKLTEAILLQSEIMDLKVNYNTTASGVILEARLDKTKGVVATLLIRRGSLKIGDLLLAGISYGKVRSIKDDHGVKISIATPSMPVEIYGLNTLPKAGEVFNVLNDDRQVKHIIDYRSRIIKEQKLVEVESNNLKEKDLFFVLSDRKKRELALIIKVDVQGSLEVIIGSISKLVDNNNEVKTKIVHSGVGDIIESDIMLAKAAGAILVAFNVKTSATAQNLLEKEKVTLKHYSTIYSLIDDISSFILGLTTPKVREQNIGSAEVRKIFSISKVGNIAGSYVNRGVIKRNALIKILRDGIIIYQGKLKHLKRFKDEVKEVRDNFECGLALEGFHDLKIGDVIEAFENIVDKNC